MAGSPSLRDLRSLSARLQAYGGSNHMDKFEHIRIALQSRDDELLTKLLNQRCVQLRAIGMAKETKLDFGGIKYKRGQDLFKTAERIFLKLNLCSGGGELEQWVWELNEVNLGIRFPTAVKARAAVSVDIHDVDTDTIKLMLEQEQDRAEPDDVTIVRTDDAHMWHYFSV